MAVGESWKTIYAISLPQARSAIAKYFLADVQLINFQLSYIISSSVSLFTEPENFLLLMLKI